MRLDDVLNIESARFIRVARNLDRPGTRFELLRVTERVVLVDAEFVVVVIGRKKTRIAVTEARDIAVLIISEIQGLAVICQVGKQRYYEFQRWISTIQAFAAIFEGQRRSVKLSPDYRR